MKSWEWDILLSRWKEILSAVATSISTPLFNHINSFRGFDKPPAIPCTFMCLNSGTSDTILFNAFYVESVPHFPWKLTITCSTNSLVGTKTIARACWPLLLYPAVFSWSFNICRMGRRYERVFPVPVWSAANTWRPSNIRGIASA